MHGDLFSVNAPWENVCILAVVQKEVNDVVLVKKDETPSCSCLGVLVPRQYKAGCRLARDPPTGSLQCEMLTPPPSIANQYPALYKEGARNPVQPSTGEGDSGLASMR